MKLSGDLPTLVVSSDSISREDPRMISGDCCCCEKTDRISLSLELCQGIVILIVRDMGLEDGRVFKKLNEFFERQVPRGAAISSGDCGEYLYVLSPFSFQMRELHRKEERVRQGKSGEGRERGSRPGEECPGEVPPQALH
jgi:hypothetical protein